MNVLQNKTTELGRESVSQKFHRLAAEARAKAAMRRSGTKAQAAEFLNWGIYLVILGLVLGFGSIILTSFTTTGNVPANSIAANTINFANQGLATMGQYLPDIALVVVASGMILLIVRSLVGAVGGSSRAGQI